MMRYILILVVPFSISIFFSCKNENTLSKSSRPNIIFIMSDDHAYQAISAYDDRLIQTPQIDRIGKEGIIFTNACVTNSICAPSRAVILTGKHSHINGKIDNHTPFDTSNITFPQLFKAGGYQTAMFGKLHFGNNPKGFDKFMILPGQGEYYNPIFITEKGDTTIQGYTTDIITDLTIDWLDKSRQEDKPFMLMYLHKAPHREWLPPGRLLQKFTSRTFPVPESLFDDYANRGTAAKTAEMNILHHLSWTADCKLNPNMVESLGLKDHDEWTMNRYRDYMDGMSQEQRDIWNDIYDPINEDFRTRYPEMDSTKLMQWKYQRYIQDYLGTIAAIDENVGRLLKYLDDNGLSDNTMIVYTSDQGFYLGEHGWFDKRFIYDESFKTPLLIKWPKVIKPGRVSKDMVQNLDFAQTFLEAAQINIPDNMQGESFLSILKSEKEKWNREAVYYHYYEYPSAHMVKRHYGIVTEDYKLVRFYYDIDEWELYDRKNDPSEMTNVFHYPEYQPIVNELKVKLSDLRAHYKDSEELDQYFIQQSGFK